MARSALLNRMVQAALKAGRSLTRDYGEIENLQGAVTGPGQFAAAADKRCEEIIMKALSAARSDYGFLMKRRGEIKGSDPFHQWIVNSLDGLTNFFHALPFFAISIALERNKQIVAGVIYNPITEELFTAEKGKGAFLNDQRLRVAARKGLFEAALATELAHRGSNDHLRCMAELKTATACAAAICSFGCSALGLAYVAAGRCDGYWAHNLSPCDMAAGLVLVREAGGFLCDVKGGRQMFATGGIIAGNEPVCNAIRDKIVNPA